MSVGEDFRLSENGVKYVSIPKMADETLHWARSAEVTDEMIERVSKALLSHQIKTGQCDQDIHWSSFCGEAIAAIDAMREPTDAMRKACHGEPVSQHWGLMIDAALDHPRSP